MLLNEVLFLDGLGQAVSFAGSATSKGLAWFVATGGSFK
jgi:hypothetical protein